MTHLRVSWLLPPVLTRFLSDATDYFSHMHQRWEVRGKNRAEKKFATTGYRTRKLQVRSQLRYLLSYSAVLRNLCESWSDKKVSLGNSSIIKSWSQSFKSSLKFHSKCKRLMTFRIHPLNVRIYEISVNIWKTCDYEKNWRITLMHFTIWDIT